MPKILPRIFILSYSFMGTLLHYLPKITLHKKGLKQLKKVLDQLLGARSTQNLNEIHIIGCSTNLETGCKPVLFIFFFGFLFFLFVILFYSFYLSVSAHFLTFFVFIFMFLFLCFLFFYLFSFS